MSLGIRYCFVTRHGKLVGLLTRKTMHHYVHTHHASAPLPPVQSTVAANQAVTSHSPRPEYSPVTRQRRRISSVSGSSMQKSAGTFVSTGTLFNIRCSILNAVVSVTIAIIITYTWLSHLFVESRNTFCRFACFQVAQRWSAHLHPPRVVSAVGSLDTVGSPKPSHHLAYNGRAQPTLIIILTRTLRFLFPSLLVHIGPLMRTKYWMEMALQGACGTMDTA